MKFDLERFKAGEVAYDKADHISPDVYYVGDMPDGKVAIRWKRSDGTWGVCDWGLQTLNDRLTMNPREEWALYHTKKRELLPHLYKSKEVALAQLDATDFNIVVPVKLRFDGDGN